MVTHESHIPNDSGAEDLSLWRQFFAEQVAPDAGGPDAGAPSLMDLAAMLEGGVSDDERARIERWMSKHEGASGLLGAVPEADAEVCPSIIERAERLVAGSPVIEVGRASLIWRIGQWSGSIAASIVVGVIGYSLGMSQPTPVSPVVESQDSELIAAMSFGVLNDDASDGAEDSAADLFAFELMGVSE